MLIDISPPLSPRLAVWPGDTPVSREVLLERARGDAVTLSTLRATVHLGAHADAPNHVAAAGAGAEALALEDYVGPCQVIRVEVRRGERVRPAHLRSAPVAPRILIATGTFPDPDRFTTDFAALSAELIDTLAAGGVRLVGIDTPSVDVFDSKDLPAHHACLHHGMAILEGLTLREVPAGCYELIALPLPLAGFDASPVRAVLRV
jgi:arylformamidase